MRSPVLVHACGRRCDLCGQECEVRRRDLPPLLHGLDHRSPVELWAATLAYLYQKLNEASNWRTRQLTGSCTLLTVRFRIYFVSYLFLIHYRVCVSELDHLLLLPHPRLPLRSCICGRHAQGRQIRSPEGERCGGTIPFVLGPHDARRCHL